MAVAKFRFYAIEPENAEGLGWTGTEKKFDRIPLRMKTVLPEVWKHGKSSTGVCIYFRTDSSRIRVRYDLESAELGEQNYNVSSHSGVDLYVWIEAEKRWKWAGATPHFIDMAKHQEYDVIHDIRPEMRLWRMYFPLRNRVLKMAVGTDREAAFELLPPRRGNPMVYYGTSIIHGAFSIRSGLCVAERLGRLLDIPLVNLGFSGAAKLEPEMADLLAELKAKFYIVDAYHNLSHQLVLERQETFLRKLCSAKPRTPVYFLTAPGNLLHYLRPAEIQAEERAKDRAMKSITRKLMKEFPNLHFVDGKRFYGSEDVSMDGVHPNDEAFSHMARILARRIASGK